MFINDKKLLVVGVDHGFSMMKTPHATFENGVEKLGGEATLSNNTLVYEGNYYKVGEGRLPLMEKKTENDNYFLLTLAAVAKEMVVYHQSEANVVLAVGLPFSRFGKEKMEFKSYLLRQGEIAYSYCGKRYCIYIQDVYVFPQCYAAIADKLREYGRENLIVDIGSKTIDVIHTRNYVPVESESTSIPEALIQCMEGIKNKVYQNCNRIVSEEMIRQMIQGEAVVMPEDCKVIIIEELKKYAVNIEARLAELGFDMEMMNVVYAGGGASVMKNHGTKKSANIHYLLDIRANAKGFEFLAIQKGKF